METSACLALANPSSMPLINSPLANYSPLANPASNPRKIKSAQYIAQIMITGPMAPKKTIIKTTTIRTTTLRIRLGETTAFTKN